MDIDFSKSIRDTLSRGETYIGPLFTQEEAEALMDIDDDVNPNMPTRAAEELIYRSTGVNVELAPQGAADQCIGATTANRLSTQNTITIEQAQLRKRAYDPDHPDTKLVPSITPDDANEAVTSITFPQLKPTGTPLDKMRLDSKENPAERCLSNALTVAQILSHWEVDVDNLCKCIDAIYGISYSKKLIKDASFANISDLSEFIASGGRPAPTSYISPNITSRYMVATRPTYSVGHMFSSSIFFGRAIELAKFIAVTTNLVHGRNFRDTFYFEMNPAQFSTFDPNMISPAGLPSNFVPKRSLMSSSIPHVESIEVYIKHRQPARVAFHEASRSLATILRKEETYRPVDVKSLFASWNNRKNADIMSTNPTDSSKREMFTEEAAPKRVSAVACGIAHKEMGVSNLASLEALCYFHAVLALRTLTAAELATEWPNWKTMRGLSDAVSAINSIAAKDIADYSILTKMGQGSAESARLMVTHRHTRHIHMAVVNAVEAARECKTAGRSDRRMPRWKGYGQGNSFRLYSYVMDYLSTIQSTQPFRAYSKAKGQLYGMEVECSMLTASAKRMAAMLKSAQAQINADRNISDNDKSKIRIRHMFSRLRETWANFYSRRAMAKMSLLDIASVNLAKTVKDVFTMAKNNQASEELVYDLLQGFAIEAIWEHAASLAYKFAEISVVGLELSGDLKTDLEVYKAWLTEEDADGTYAALSKKVVIDMHKEKLARKSALSDKVAECTAFLIGPCRIGDQVNSYVKRVMGFMYLKLGNKVKDSVIECLRLDREIITNIPGYEKIAAMRPIKVAEPPAPDAVESDLQAFSLDLSVLGADDDDVPMVEYSKDVKTVSFQLSECQGKFTCLDTYADVNSAIKYLTDRDTLCLVAETENWGRLKHISKAMEGMCSGGACILNILMPAQDLKFIISVAKSVGYQEKNSVTLMTS